MAWESQKLVGLYDRPGRGRNATFTPDQREQIRQWVKQHPKRLQPVLDQIETQWEIRVSKDTLKRVLKGLAMSWRRMRRRVGQAADETELRDKQRQLEQLQQRASDGEIDLRYLDESGFCLTPSVPYAWQAAGETLSLPSQRSKRLNVVGLMNRANELEAYVFEGSITSEVMIACIDAFAQTVRLPSVIISRWARLSLR